MGRMESSAMVECRCVGSLHNLTPDVHASEEREANRLQGQDSEAHTSSPEGSELYRGDKGKEYNCDG